MIAKFWKPKTHKSMKSQVITLWNGLRAESDGQQQSLVHERHGKNTARSTSWWITC